MLDASFVYASESSSITREFGMRKIKMCLKRQLLIEKRMLDVRIDALKRHIASEAYLRLGVAEQSRLSDQRETMTAYSRILQERLAALGVK